MLGSRVRISCRLQHDHHTRLCAPVTSSRSRRKWSSPGAEVILRGYLRTLRLQRVVIMSALPVAKNYTHTHTVYEPPSGPFPDSIVPGSESWGMKIGSHFRLAGRFVAWREPSFTRRHSMQRERENGPLSNTHTNTHGDDNGFNVPPRALPLGPFLTVGERERESDGKGRGWIGFCSTFRKLLARRWRCSGECRQSAIENVSRNDGLNIHEWCLHTYILLFIKHFIDFDDKNYSMIMYTQQEVHRIILWLCVKSLFTLLSALSIITHTHCWINYISIIINEYIKSMSTITLLIQITIICSIFIY